MPQAQADGSTKSAPASGLTPVAPSASGRFLPGAGQSPRAHGCPKRKRTVHDGAGRAHPPARLPQAQADGSPQNQGTRKLKGVAPSASGRFSACRISSAGDTGCPKRKRTVLDCAGRCQITGRLPQAQADGSFKWSAPRAISEVAPSASGRFDEVGRVGMAGRGCPKRKRTVPSRKRPSWKSRRLPQAQADGSGRTIDSDRSHGFAPSAI